MKTIIWALTLLIIAAAVILELRYSIVIDSPVVAKLDRLRGDVWIANAGQLMIVKHAGEVCIPPEKPSAPPETKAK